MPALLVAILGLLLVAATPASAASIGHRFSTSFEGSGTSALSTGITSVDVDNSTGPSKGDVYVTDATNHRVEKFTSGGAFILMFGDNVNATNGGDLCTAASGDTCKAGNGGTSSEQLGTPTYIAVDGSNSASRGDVYVADTGSNTVHKYDEDGNLVTSWGSGGAIDGSGSGAAFANISGIDVNPTNGALLTWSVSNFKFRLFSQAGTYISGIEPCRGNNEAGTAISPDGNFYYKVNGDSTVERVSSDNSSCAQVSEEGFSTSGMTVDQSTGTLYRVEGGTRVGEYLFNGERKPIDINGVATCTPEEFSSCPATRHFGNESSELSGAKGIGVDVSTDTVYVADTTNHRIAVFPPLLAPLPVTEGPVANETVSGTVKLDGAGEIVDCLFEWGETPTPPFAKQTTCSPNPAASPPGSYFSVDTPVTATLSPVTGENTYYYRLVATNLSGAKNFGQIKSIVPHNVNALKTEPASNLARTAARLNASYLGTGEDTHYYFEWAPGPGSCPCANKTATPPGDDRGVTSGPTPLFADISGLTAGATYHYRVVAENVKGTSIANSVEFTTNPAVNAVVTTAATAVGTSTATFNGSLDPDGIPTSYYFQWGKDTGYGQATPLPPGPSLVDITPGDQAVSADVADLESGTTYHYRLVGVNSFGETVGNDETFTTPQPPSITSFSATNITAQDADLIATVNPNGYATTYRFEYGVTLDYGSTVPIPQDGELAADSEVHPIIVHISDLDEKTYHFRLIATNIWGTVTTEDQTFDFNAPIGCPNQHLRQQTGAAYLPDCRAYELVSASRAGGAAVLPEGPISPYATGRFPYSAAINLIPGSGEPQNAEFLAKDLYMATRHSDGWVTRYVGLPGSQGLSSGSAPGREYGGQVEQGWGYDGFNYPNAVPADKTLNHLLIWDRKGFTLLNQKTKLHGTNAPNVYDSEGNLVGKLPTNADEVPGGNTDLAEEGWIGSARINPNYTHYAFSSLRTAFAPGGLIEEPGSAYDDNLETGTVSLISKTESGEDIPEDLSSGYSEEFIRIPAVSNDGTHILMATAAPPYVFDLSPYWTHLYISVNEGEGQYAHYDISVDKNSNNVGVHFERMSSDGSTVYFTTDKQMTADDTDTSTDLYAWREATNTLTRVSDSGNLPGNTDSCSAEAGWTTKCGVEVIPYTPLEANHRGSTKFSDVPMALDTGEIYFYSPEQLDGARGVRNKRNLYVYRNGKAQFVATLNGTRGVERINVSPDGSHMAMMTRTQLTAYDNGGFAEMYLYDPAARTIKCVSCLPSGEPPTSNVKGAVNGWFMSFDGRPFFSTADPLVPQDANHASDVYEFVNGRAQLISTGTGREAAGQEANELQPVGLISVSGDGVDAIFATYETLVKQDENGDIYKFYDARVAGGIPAPPETTPCEAADECHGEDRPRPAPPEIGSSARLGESGNFHVQAAKRKCRRAKHRNKKSCRQRRSDHKRGKHG